LVPRLDTLFTLSPRPSSDEAAQVTSDGGVELLRQGTARAPPRLDLIQPESRAADPAPVLMGHGISPRVQGLQLGLASGVLGVERDDCWPEGHAEPAEVGAQVAGVRVALVKLASLHEEVLNDRAEDRGRDGSDDEGDGLGVQVTAEPLELRRQQRDVGVVHLERRKSAAPTAATDGTVSVLDLVESVLGVVLPALKRT
jgi:hypothetical protein